LSSRFIALVCAAGLVGIAQVGHADIRASRHNLACAVTASSNASEICIFCHTPEGVSPAQAARPPGWVRTPLLLGAFTVYADADASADAVGTGPASHSLVCLSCHDGSHAPNTNLVERGKDHPWGVPYSGAIEAWVPAAGPTGGGLATTPDRTHNDSRREEFRQAISSVIGGRRVWWVPRNAAATLRTRLDIPLYSRGAPGAEIPFVECASCHDPHSDQALFLRVANSGSALCYTCHAK